MDIKSIAKQRGMTMNDIAERLGINRVGLSQSINNNPTLRTLQSIADVLGCSVGDFFRDEIKPDNCSNINVNCPHCGKPFNVCVNVSVSK